MNRGFGVLTGGVFLYFFASTTFLFAQVGDPLAGQSSRYLLADAWAPVVFHDTATEFTDPETGFNPVDNLVGLFFDENRDLRDNADNSFHLSISQIQQVKQSTPVYFSIVETEDHYYINYIFYHAIDAGVEGHVHDTENLWTVIQKDGTRYGKLVMHITNAHGFGMIYGPTFDGEASWRKRMPKTASRNFLPYLDRFSKDHEEVGAPEYVNRKDSQSLKIFISAKSHAIYKCSSEVWREKQGRNGIIYIPGGCENCLNDAFQFRSPVRLYKLIDWDLFLDQSLQAANLGERELSAFLKVFTPLDNERKPSGSIYVPRGLPDSLVAGFGEEMPKANLFYRSSLKSPFDLSDPVLVHRYFAPDAKLSQKYLFNTYVEDDKPKDLDPRFARWMKPLKRTSLFGMVSELWEN